MGLANRLISGSLLNSTNLVLSIIISFFMMPYMVSSLGDRMYGVWTIVAEFLWYYGLLDFGLSTAIGRYLAQSIGRNDNEEIKRITSTSFYLTFGLGMFSLLVTLILVVLVPTVVKPEEVQLFRILLVILGVNFTVEFPVRVFNSVLGAHLRFDIVMISQIIKNIITAILVVYVLASGYGVIGVAIVTFLTSFADSMVLVYFSYRVDPNISISPKYFINSVIHKLVGYSVYSFVAKISDILRFKVDLFVITAFINLGAVTHYFIAARLLDYFIRFIMAVIQVIGPVFSREEGKNDYNSIRGKFLTVTKISIYLSVFFGVLAILYGESFIRRWMGDAYIDSYQLLVVLMVPAIVSLLQNPSEHLLYAISKHKFLAWSSFLEGIFNLAISLALVQKYGLVGVALGTAIPMSIRYLVLPFYVCHVIDISFPQYTFMIARHVMGSCAIILVVHYSLRSYMMPSYPVLISIFLTMNLIYWPIVFFIGFNRKERGYVLKYIRRGR